MGRRHEHEIGFDAEPSRKASCHLNKDLEGQALEDILSYPSRHHKAVL